MIKPPNNKKSSKRLQESSLYTATTPNSRVGLETKRMSGNSGSGNSGFTPDFEEESDLKSPIPYAIHEELILLEQWKLESQLLDMEVKHSQLLEQLAKREGDLEKLVYKLTKTVEGLEDSNQKLKQELQLRKEENGLCRDEIGKLEKSIDEYIKKLKDAEVGHRIKSIPEKLKQSILDGKETKSLEDQI